MTIDSEPLNGCSLPEQQETVRLLDEQFEAVERSKREISAPLWRSEPLRQLPLHRTLTGPLVTQFPPDVPASILIARLHTGRAASQTPAMRRRISAS